MVIVEPVVIGTAKLLEASGIDLGDLAARAGELRGDGQTVVFVTHSVFESVYLSRRIMVMTSRPGRVFAEIEVDTVSPRDADFRTSTEYAVLCRRTSEALAAAAATREGR